MNRIPHSYGLLIGVGMYDMGEEGVDDLKRLPGTGKDLALMKEALTDGLKFDPENIRLLGEDGTVKALSFARALSEFETLLGRDDTFVLYFSGHGSQGGLCFTDEIVNLQSIVSFIERLPAGRKIVILDCCYSGDMQITDVQELTFEEMITVFAGRGIAVMASSAPDERSWLSQAGDASLYTKVMASAILSRRHIREGRISLHDVNDEIRCLMQQWNRMNPDRQQHPVYRENYIGDIAFAVEEYHPYVTQKITAETQDYVLHGIKPLSTGQLKRFAAFVTLRKADDTQLPRITREIVSQFRNSDVYANASSEHRFRGRSADAIWCYFGYDEEDIARSNHFAYTIWAATRQLQEMYYRENRNAEITDGIYIFWNASYGMVKELQKTDAPEEKIMAQYRELAGLLTRKAEAFIRDFEEVENRTISLNAMKDRYGSWIRDVKAAYFKLSDADPAPVSRIRWAETILELAGWVTDMALLLERKESDDAAGAAGETWMIRQAVRRYRLSLEKLFLNTGGRPTGDCTPGRS